MKKEHRSGSPWLYACIGGLLAMAISVLLSLLGAWLINKNVLSFNIVNTVAYIILGLSSAAGALFASLKGKRKLLLLCMISGAVYFLIAAVLNGILQKGQFEHLWQTTLIIFGISLAVGLLCAGRKTKY